jgi:predicted heme/steroid binding protein
MKRQTKQHLKRPGFLSLSLGFAVLAIALKSLWAASPPSPGFEKFSLKDTSKFHLTTSFSVFDERKGYVRNISLRYVYQDGRYAKMHSYDTDIVVEIEEFATAEQAQAALKKRTAKTIPEEKANTVKLPPCKGEKSGKDDFTGPEKLQKKFRHPNGSEIIVTHGGDFNMYDCQRGSNRSEYVRWTDGVYYFSIYTAPVGKGGPDTGYGRAEEFALDYLTALGQPATPAN